MQNDDGKFETIIQKVGRLTDDEMSIFLNQDAYGWATIYDHTRTVSSIEVSNNKVIMEHAAKFFENKFREAGYLIICWTGKMVVEVWNECFNLGINGPFRNFDTNWTYWKEKDYKQWLDTRDSSDRNEVIDEYLSKPLKLKYYDEFRGSKDNENNDEGQSDDIGFVVKTFDQQVDSHDKTTEAKDEKDKTTWLKETHYDDGSIHSRCFVNNKQGSKQGLRHGPCINYFETGQIQSVVMYLDGLRQGKGFYYNSDGSPKMEIDYVDDHKHGDCRTYRNGTGELETLHTFVNGEVTGKYIAYHDNGFIKEVSHYKHGELHGEFKKYTPGGWVWESGNFKDSKLHGTYRRYHTNNSMACMCEYNMDKKSGGEKTWNGKGELTSWKLYDNDMLIQERPNHTMADTFFKGLQLAPDVTKCILKEYSSPNITIKWNKRDLDVFGISDPKQQKRIFDWLADPKTIQDSQDSQKVYTFKVKQGLCYRRFCCVADLDQIQDVISCKNDEKDNIVLTYLDDEGDHVVITDNTDLFDAINSATTGLVRLEAI